MCHNLIFSNLFNFSTSDRLSRIWSSSWQPRIWPPCLECRSKFSMRNNTFNHHIRVGGSSSFGFANSFQESKSRSVSEFFKFWLPLASANHHHALMQLHIRHYWLLLKYIVNGLSRFSFRLLYHFENPFEISLYFHTAFQTCSASSRNLQTNLTSDISCLFYSSVYATRVFQSNYLIIS